VVNGRDRKAEGIAYKSSMCSQLSLSVVEAQANQNTALAAAHEIGHRLVEDAFVIVHWHQSPSISRHDVCTLVPRLSLDTFV
jgi:hypothetical protein